MPLDLAIIGAGAAGLAAAIFAGEAARGRGSRILLIEGAKKPGAKILVSGGGRCNVTNVRVAPEDFCGGPRPVIRNVLRAFDERGTVEWMRTLGVALKPEPTGKLFPTTDKAATVLDALLRAAREAGVELVAGARVVELRAVAEGGFEIRTTAHGEAIRARRVVLATGGLALPKSGSDGWGLEAARGLGHTIVPTTPALSPLLLREGPSPGGRFAEFKGLAMPARLTLRGARGEVLAANDGPLLFTHFGISGPCALDFSRHWLRARLERPDEASRVAMSLTPLASPAEADAWLLGQAREHPRRGAAAALAELVPDAFARALAGESGALGQLPRETRAELARRLGALPLDVVGDRGYAFAEATAGGVDLREIDGRTMESRRAPGLHLCGEALDVDGRLGGFNFQWAWSSGYLAGRGAAAALAGAPA